MKQVLNVSLFLVSLIFLLSVSAFAAGANIQVGSAEAMSGESVTIPVSITNSAKLVSLTAYVEYDEDIMTLTTVKDLDTLSGAVHGDKTTSPIVLTWENDCSATNYTVNGKIVELCFVVKNTAPDGKYPLLISIPNDGALDSNGNSVQLSTTGGILTVVHEVEHVCSFGEWEEENGRYHIRYCSCGENEREKHDLEEVEVTPATHTSEGEVRYTCTVCDFEETETTDMLEGHTWSEYKKIDDVNHGYECECGKEIVFPHEWDSGEIIEDATETSEGKIVYTCIECDAKITKSIPVVGAKTFSLSGTIISYGDDNAAITTLHLYAGSGASMAAAPSHTTTVVGAGVQDYSLSGISAGTYTLRVSKAGHITKDYVITIDDEDVELDVEITLKETANVTMVAEVTQFSSDSASISIQATSSSDFFGQFFVASYDENGKMLDVKVYPAAEEVLAQVDKVGSSVKVFWVDNQTSFTPVCSAVPLSTEVIPDGLYYDVYDSYVEITKYAGTDTDLTIPKTIEGVPVTKIGMYAFNGCTSLETLTLQSGITEITAFAFNDCTELESITLPEGLIEIGDLAFQSCRKLTAITIPDGVTELGWNIFNNCLELKETHIPTSVVTVDGKTILWDQAGTGITVSGDISSYFFSYWTELENVVVEDGCTFIGEGAFRDCTSLTSIVLPESITTMDSRVFADCTNLLSVTVPSKVTELGDFTFSGCRSMTNIVLPASLKTIKRYVFQSCDSFVEVEIPTGVTTIGDGAFNVCRGLKKIIIPDSVTSISDTAFNYCTGLTICCLKGSYADTYAQSKGFSVQYM